MKLQKKKRKQKSQTYKKIFKKKATFRSFFWKIKTHFFQNESLRIPLVRYESYFIPGCKERYLGTALIPNSGSNSIGDYGTHSGKQYIL